MKKLFLVGLIALTAVLMTAGAFAQRPHSIITGAVSDQANNQPLAMANVQAFSPDHPNMPVGWALTNQTGQYIMYLAPGNYKLMAVKHGFQMEWWQESRTPDSATVIAVAENDTVANVNFTLAVFVPPPPPARGTISGTVVDQATNAPLFHGMVKASVNNGMMFFAPTDSAGNYTINLPYGTYYVRAEKFGYVPEWWQEVPERTQATAVVVADSQNASGINFTLSAVTPPVVGSIAGVITNAATSAPLPRAMVQVTLLGNHREHYTVMTAEDGTYLVNRLRSGYYRVEAGKTGFVPNHYPDSVNVNGAPVTGINIALTPVIFGTLTGVVTNSATSQPIAGAWVNAASMNNARICQRAVTDSTGTYSLSLPVGMYHVEAGARGYSPARADSVSVGDLVPTVLNFALTAINFGSIAGNVFDTSNAPIFGAWIEARMIMGNWRGRARTDSAGQYTMQNVIPGSYILTAHANRYQPAVYPDTVVVADGQAVTGINFHLLPFVEPNGTIAGLVTNDTTGLPVAGAMVMAFGQNAPGRHRFTFRMTRTLENGTYLLERLPAIPFKMLCMAREYFGEFYNNKRSWVEADLVTPSAAGINFGLAPRTIGPRFLGGRILQNDQAVPGAVVILMENGEPIDVAGTYPDGSYEFANVESGNYTISVITPDEMQESVDILFNDIYSQDIAVVASSVDNDIVLPTATTLIQNYPNPFNASTNISFYLANQTSVNLSV
jgi:hypothetical protein